MGGYPLEPRYQHASLARRPNAQRRGEVVPTTRLLHPGGGYDRAPAECAVRRSWAVTLQISGVPGVAVVRSVALREPGTTAVTGGLRSSR